MTSEEREDAQFQLESDRVELAKRRVVVEESKSRNDNLFLNRKFPAVVTAIVSTAAVSFSYVQMHVATLDKNHELELLASKSDQEFRLKAAKFVSDNSELIFEGNEEQQSRIRNVILASFPPTVSNVLFARLEQAATTWSEGQKVTAAIVAKPEGTISDAPRIFLQYQDPSDTKLLNSLMSDLSAKGYRVSGRQLVTQPTQGDIRYYHDEDLPAVQRVAKLVEQFLSENDRHLVLTRLDLTKQYPSIPMGVIEVWLPRKS